MTKAKARGFTLIEAVAVIVVTGIIASVVAIFITKPVEGYVDTVRRAALTDIADSALRRIARDVRSALPNSVRTTGTYVEFIPTSDGARYRVEFKPDGSGHVAFPIDSTNSFDIFGNGTLNATIGSYAVIFNTGQCSSGCGAAAGCMGANAYEGCNRRTIQGFSTTSLTFASSTTSFPFDSPGHRVHIVPQTGPVTYACEAPSATDSTRGVTGPLVLRRYTNYATGAGTWSPVSQPTSFPASATVALLADSVSNCAFTYAPGVTQRNALLTLRLTLTRSGESVTLYHEIHVDNQP